MSYDVPKQYIPLDKLEGFRDKRINQSLQGEKLNEQLRADRANEQVEP